jgi:SAM-dependent methyltransferase
VVEWVPCNVCGSHSSQELFRKGGLAVARCRQCGLVYANPRLTMSEIWKRYSAGYFWQEYMPAHQAANGEFDAKWHSRRAQPVLDVLRPFRQQGRLLEVGCAAGFFLKLAEADGWIVKGVEIMGPAVRYANDILNIDVFEGPLEKAQFDDCHFDGAVLIETVEHLLDPAATLAEVYRILRPGGALYIAVPNLNSIMRSLLGVDWSVFSPAEHLFYFTEMTLEQLLRQTGFETTRFFWQPQDLWETMNPLNSHRPDSWRSRLVRAITLTVGRTLLPVVAAARRSDRLVCLAAKRI